MYFLAALCGMWDPSSLTRDQTLAPCIGSTESQSLDRQGSPQNGTKTLKEFSPRSLCQTS